jgi:hypothetical protein
VGALAKRPAPGDLAVGRAHEKARSFLSRSQIFLALKRCAAACTAAAAMDGSGQRQGGTSQSVPTRQRAYGFPPSRQRAQCQGKQMAPRKTMAYGGP